MPKNMRNFEESSGFFSVAGCVSFGDASEVDEGAVEAGECSKEPDDADAIIICYKVGMLVKKEYAAT